MLRALLHTRGQLLDEPFIFLVGGPDTWTALVGRWGRLVPMATVATVYFLCVWFGRRSLLSTRINHSWPR